MVVSYQQLQNAQYDDVALFIVNLFMCTEHTTTAFNEWLLTHHTPSSRGRSFPANIDVNEVTWLLSPDEEGLITQNGMCPIATPKAFKRANKLMDSLTSSSLSKQHDSLDTSDTVLSQDQNHDPWAALGPIPTDVFGMDSIVLNQPDFFSGLF